jgi:hypothetical protein
MGSKRVLGGLSAAADRPPAHIYLTWLPPSFRNLSRSAPSNPQAPLTRPDKPLHG